MTRSADDRFRGRRRNKETELMCVESNTVDPVCFQLVKETGNHAQIKQNPKMFFCKALKPTWFERKRGIIWRNRLQKAGMTASSCFFQKKNSAQFFVWNLAGATVLWWTTEQWSSILTPQSSTEPFDHKQSDAASHTTTTTTSDSQGSWQLHCMPSCLIQLFADVYHPDNRVRFPNQLSITQPFPGNKQHHQGHSVGNVVMRD